MPKLGEVVRELREARGWTQVELAERAGLSSSHVSYLESGERINVTLWVVCQIANALEVSLDYLLAQIGVYESGEPNEIPSPEMFGLARGMEDLPPEEQAIVRDLITFRESLEGLQDPDQEQLGKEVARQITSIREFIRERIRRAKESRSLLPPRNDLDITLTAMSELGKVHTREITPQEFLKRVDALVKDIPEERREQSRRQIIEAAAPSLLEHVGKDQLFVMTGVAL